MNSTLKLLLGGLGLICASTAVVLANPASPHAPAVIATPPAITQTVSDSQRVQEAPEKATDVDVKEKEVETAAEFEDEGEAPAAPLFEGLADRIREANSKTKQPISAPTVTPSTSPEPTYVPVPTFKPESVPAPKPVSVPVTAPNGTYTNTAGEEVPSPYHAPSAPAGASAQCRDGTYSFSQSRRGTCSGHGGVAEWL